jgi:hypothetical protein
MCACQWAHSRRTRIFKTVHGPLKFPGPRRGRPNTRTTRPGPRTLVPFRHSLRESPSRARTHCKHALRTGKTRTSGSAPSGSVMMTSPDAPAAASIVRSCLQACTVRICRPLSSPIAAQRRAAERGQRIGSVPFQCAESRRPRMCPFASQLWRLAPPLPPST